MYKRQLFEQLDEESTQEEIMNIKNGFNYAKKVISTGCLLYTSGEHIYDKYIEAKEAEWNDYRAAVTQWEIDEYLYLSLIHI